MNKGFNLTVQRIETQRSVDIIIIGRKHYLACSFFPTPHDMSNQEFSIVRYEESLRDQVLTTWEKSVMATHHFLTEEDFKSIKEAVFTMVDFHAFPVFCLMRGPEVAGFIGVADRKVEMLFVAPEYFGQGLGRKLMDFAFRVLHVNKVDVNLQNVDGVRFYRKFGFKPYEQTILDDQGRPYPLIRMKLK